DTYIAIQVSGAPGSRPVEATCGSHEDSPALVLSKSIAGILLRRLSSNERAGAGPTGDTLSIQANTQAHWQGLRIGVGNIWEEPRGPRERSARGRLTAGLWIVGSDDVSEGQRLRVHPGQTLRYFGYVIRILSIEPGIVRVVLSPEAGSQRR
ncbi:MAG: hypothetical protein ACRD2X_20605, partial [Vicinamibacteraceae bacterium]